MLTDSFYEIGKTHEVCEDYATSGENFAIVSDGCSNGGGPRIDTDWGSRIIAKAAEQHLKVLSNSNIESFLSAVGATAQTQCASFPNLVPECLTATLLLLVKPPSFENIFGLVVGDGTIGGQRIDGSWVIYHYEFVQGGTTNKAAPFYLKYMMNNEIDKYVSMFGGKLKQTKYEGKLDGEMKETEEILEFNPQEPWQQHWFCPKDFRFTFVASDGTSSFYQKVQTETQKHNDPIPFLDVMRVLLDVTTVRPGFLRLQRQWCFRRENKGTFRHRNWHNGDDVSMAGIIT